MTKSERNTLRLSEVQHEQWSKLMAGSASEFPPELRTWLMQVGERYGGCSDQLYNLVAAYVRGETMFADVPIPTVA